MTKRGFLTSEDGAAWNYEVFPDKQMMQVWRDNPKDPAGLGTFSNPMDYSFAQIITAHKALPRKWQYMFDPIKEFLTFAVTIDTN